MSTYTCDAFGNCYYTNDWYIWGRWALLGAIIVFVIFLCLMIRCVNSRRMKRGGGPVRYTGWTVPSYNQSQQQYGYTGGAQPQGAYDMNSYPQQGPYPQQQGGISYQGQPQTQYSSPPAEGAAGTTPVYYDATQTEAGHSGYQPPAYPPPVGKA